MEGNSNTLEFSLSEMGETYNRAVSYTNKYEGAITSIDSAINQLAEVWKSSETATYEKFVELYNSKRQSLFDALDLMNRFCAKLSEKEGDFDEASTAIKNSME